MKKIRQRAQKQAQKELENTERKELKQKALQISEQLKGCDIKKTAEIVKEKMEASSSNSHENVEERDEIPNDISDISFSDESGEEFLPTEYEKKSSLYNQLKNNKKSDTSDSSSEDDFPPPLSFLENERIRERCVRLQHSNNYEKFDNLKKNYIKLANESTKEIKTLREINEEYDRKIEKLREEKTKTMKNAEDYWREAQMIIGTVPVKTRIGKSKITDKHQKCVLAHCSGFALNLRRHLAQAHKIVSKDEQDELLEKFQNKNFEQKKGKRRNRGGTCSVCKGTFARLDAHIHKHHYNRDTKEFKDALSNCIRNDEKEINNVKLDSGKSIPTSLEDSVKILSKKFEKHLSKQLKQKPQTSSRTVNYLKEFIDYEDENLNAEVTAKWVVHHIKKIDVKTGYIMDIKEKLSASTIRKRLDALGHFLHFVHNTPDQSVKVDEIDYLEASEVIKSCKSKSHNVFV